MEGALRPTETAVAQDFGVQGSELELMVQVSVCLKNFLSTIIRYSFLKIFASFKVILGLVRLPY